VNNRKHGLRAIMVLVICAFCLTGCMRFNTTVTVKSNGKLDVSMLYAMMDMSDYGYDADSMTDTQMQEYKDQGWDVEEYNQDGFKGYILSKKDITANELESSMEDTQSELSGEASSIKFTKQGLKYVLDWQVFDRNQGEQLSAYKNYFTMSGGYMKITVNLPVKPSDSNATYVSNDGKTLEWDLLNLGPEQSIHLEFTLVNIWLIIGLCAAAAVVVIGIVLAIVLSSKKKKAVQMQSTGYYQQNGNYPPQGQFNNTQYQPDPRMQQPIQTVQQYQPQTPVNPEGQQAMKGSLVADELTKLKKLLDDGVITREEFEAQKSKLLEGQ